MSLSEYNSDPKSSSCGIFKKNASIIEACTYPITSKSFPNVKINGVVEFKCEADKNYNLLNNSQIFKEKCFEKMEYIKSDLEKNKTLYALEMRCGEVREFTKIVKNLQNISKNYDLDPKIFEDILRKLNHLKSKIKTDSGCLLKKLSEEFKMEDSMSLSYFPINIPELEKYVDEQEAQMWTVEEISYQNDRDIWDTLDDATRDFIKFLLFFFAQADGIVNENLMANFQRETSVYKEATHFYAIQADIERVHAKTYSMFIDTLIRDEAEKLEGFDAIKHHDCIREIAIWIMTWMDDSVDLRERIVAFACFEGVLFSGCFAGIYWLKKIGILIYGLLKANEMIARDEGTHTRFGVALYNYMTRKDPNPKTRRSPLPQERVHTIIRSCINVAKNFLKKALESEPVGICYDDLLNYNKCCGDALSESLGYERIWHIVNPLPWMIVISLDNKSNFFETQSTEYRHTALSDEEFSTNEEF
jgi:ribonucleoside-diphosphate reductase subunit M2